MRVIKLALLLVVVAAWMVGWNHRAPVVAAYTEEREPIDIRLQGIDQVPELGSPTPSPYVLAKVDQGPPAPLGLAIPAPPPAPVSLGGGEVALSGVVVDPLEQPLPGATVRIERITSTGRAVQDVVTDVEGRWSATGLAGGRFRVRAFVPGVMRSVSPQVLNLSAGASQELVSRVAPPSEATHFRLVAPDQIFVGTAGTVAITASRELVDGDGILVDVPIPALAITARVAGVASLLSADQMVTDGGGAARFLVSCDGLGQPTISASSGIHNSLLALPDCIPLPPPEPEEPAEGQPADDGVDG